MSFHPKKSLFYFGLIVLLNLLAYCPSFFDPPRSDQIVYLANTTGQKDWYTLALKNYAYNRSHQEYGNPRDEFLFRPIFYFILGSQRWAFGYNFLFWQLSSFLLHITAAGLLLKLLLKIHPGKTAFFMTAFFSLMPANNDMVTWHHMSGYLVTSICLLLAINRIWFSKPENNNHPWPTVLVVTLIMTVASFTYETCVLFSLLFALAMATGNFQRAFPNSFENIYKGLVASLPAFLFAAFNILDQTSKGIKNLALASNLFDFPHLIYGLHQSVHATFWWLYTGSFMTQLKIFPYQRTMIFPYYAFSNNGLISCTAFALLSVVTSLALTFLFFYLLWKCSTSNPVKRSWSRIVLILGMLIIFILTISIGRLTTGELRFKLAENSYYGYLFWLFTLITCYIVIPFKVAENYMTSTVLRRTLSVLCTAAITLNFLITLDINLRRSHQMRSQKRLLAETAELIRHHAHESDFTFNVAGSIKDHVYAPWIARTDVPSDRGFVYLQLLYPNYYSDKNPKFTFTAEKGFR